MATLASSFRSFALALHGIGTDPREALELDQRDFDVGVAKIFVSPGKVKVICRRRGSVTY